MVVGFIAIVAAFAAFVYASNNQVLLRRFKRNHPGLCCVGVVGAGYLLICLFGSVIVFMFGIALPLLGMPYYRCCLNIPGNDLKYFHLE
jgi:hypothetical protein